MTSAQVLEELLHAYLPVNRVDARDAALTLANARIAEVWPLERDDVRLARVLVASYPALTARDLLHLACCQRHDVRQVKTFDRALGAAF